MLCLIATTVLYNLCIIKIYIHNEDDSNLFLLAIMVSFVQSTYSVNEGDGLAQIGLVLSGEPSTATTVQVFNTDGSATGKYCSILINY